jgi:hypothetical protein
MISATIEEMLRGAWVADTVDTVAPTGAFTTADGVGWSGAVFSQSLDGGRYYARIVGGKGKLATVLPDKWYNGTSLIDQIVSDAVAEAGETIGTSNLGTRVDSWMRKSTTLGQTLSQIAETMGAIWWVGRDGKINMSATRSGVDVPEDSVNVTSSDVDGSVFLNPFPAAPVIAPAGTWKGQTIRHVRWVQVPENITATLLFHELESPPLTWDYLRTYSAKVDRQNADGSIDVIADSKFAVTNVKWLAGLPGKIVINGGDEVTIGWLGGDPRTPIAWGIKMGTNGKAAARVDDSVDCGWLVLPLQGAGSGTVTWVAPSYFPPTSPTAALDAAAYVTLNTPALCKAFNIVGKITSGQSRVLL